MILFLFHYIIFCYIYWDTFCITIIFGELNIIGVYTYMYNFPYLIKNGNKHTNIYTMTAWCLHINVNVVFV